MKRTTLIALALPLLVLAGCAGGTTPQVASAAGTGAPVAPAASEGPAPAEDLQERALQFAQCMRDHGVDMPDPQFDGDRVGITIGGAPGDQAKIEEAQQACEQYAPGIGGGGGELDPETAEQMRAYAQCMRDNGVPEFPDPGSGGLQVRVGGPDGLDPEAMEAAEEACRDLRPEIAGGRAAGGGA
jgi:hypothetical protein